MLRSFSFLLFLILIASAPSVAQIYTGAISTPFTSGQLRTATIAAIDPRNGNLLVADKGRNKILRFNGTTFLSEFGTSGSNAGQFCNINALTVSPKGQIYVIDLGNGRIQKFGESGDFQSKTDLVTNPVCQPYEVIASIAVNFSDDIYISLGNLMRKIPLDPLQKPTEWGELGVQISASKFDQPIQYFAIDNKLNLIYVAARSSEKPGTYINKYNLNGGLIKSWKIETSFGGRDFNTAVGMGVDDNSNVYVASAGVIHKYDEEGVFLGGFVALINNALDGARGTTVDKAGNVYVPAESAVQVYGSAGTFTQSVGATLDGGQLVGAAAAATDGQGNIYVLDKTANFVNKYNLNGQYVTRWGGFGSTPGKFITPTAIAIDNTGIIYVADYGNNRIQKFNGDGNFTGEFGGAGTDAGKFTGGPSAITIDGNQNVIVSDGTRLQKFSPTGIFLSALSSMSVLPNGLTNDVQGNIVAIQPYYVTRISPLDGSIIQQANSPNDYYTSVATDGDGNVYVSVLETLNIPVRKYTWDGLLRTTWGGFPKAIAVDRPRGVIYLVFKNVVKRYSAFHVNDPAITKGEKGTTVTITGAGFSDVISKNVVRFNKAQANITAATTTQLTITVPPTATTGRISVQRDSVTSDTRSDFIVLPYGITRLSPSAVLPGDSVGVVGTGFSPTKRRNRVWLGDVELVTGLSTPTLVRAFVPFNAKTGKIKIATANETSTSPNDLLLTRLRINKVTFPKAYIEGRNDAVVTLEVNNTSEVKSVKVYARGLSSGPNFTATSTTFTQSGGNINVPVPRAIFTDPIGSEVYIALIDSEGGEVTSDPANIKITHDPKAAPLTMPGLRFGASGADYQLVSFPLEFEDNRVSVVLRDLDTYDDKKWRMYSYSAGNSEMNKPESGIIPGRGYWLIVKNETTIRLSAGTTLDVPYPLTLYPGLNLIGNPYDFAISWNDVKAFNTSLKAVGDLRFFSNGTYQKGDVLQKFQGAFVKLDSAVQVTLLIPPTKAAGSGRTYKKELAAIDQPAWEVPFRIDDGLIVNELAGIGMDPRASNELDRLDETEIPAPDGVNTYQFRINKLGPNIIHKDVVSPNNNYSWTGEIISDNVVTLNWDNSFFGNNEKQLVIDIDGQADLVDMRMATVVRFAKGTRSFRVHYGDKAYIEKMTIGKEPLAGHLSPNPLSRSVNSVSMAVSIPQGGGLIDLSFVDMTGKEHKFASDLAYPEGRHVLGLNADVTNMPAGLYVVRTIIRGESYSRSFYQKLVID